MSVFISYIPKNLNNNQSCHFYPQNHICPSSGWMVNKMHSINWGSFFIRLTICDPYRQPTLKIIIINMNDIILIGLNMNYFVNYDYCRRTWNSPLFINHRNPAHHCRWSNIMNSSKCHPSYLAKCDIIIIGRCGGASFVKL